MPDRRVSVGIDADISGFTRGLLTAGAEAKTFAHELESADGRMANLVQTGLALAPALVPLGAAAVPAIAGLTLQLGLAAGAAGVAVLAFHGVGDALKALDAYQAAPTAANFEKLNTTLDKLGPAGQEFVLAVDKMKPKLQELQDVAEAGLLPGVTDGLHEFIAMAPEVSQVIFTIASTLGDLSREAGKGLSSDGMKQFFDYINVTARPVLTEMGHTFGNFLEGFANVVVAFDPLARSFSTGLLDISKAFKDSTANLGDNQGFQDFVAYVQASGPKALDALESIGNLLIQLVEAAAPVGSVVLPIISDLADVLAKVADSPIGPLLIGTAAAIGVLGRSLKLLEAVGLRGANKNIIGRVLDPGAIKAGAVALGTVTSASDRARLSVTKLEAVEKERAATVRAGAVQFGKTAALVGGLALATSGLADKTGLSNTVSLALMGTIAGPFGAVLGAGAGLMLDLKDSTKDVTAAMRDLDAATANGSYIQMLQARSNAEKVYADKNKLGIGALSKVAFTLGGDVHLGPLHVNGKDPTGTIAMAADLKAANDQISKTTSAYRGLADLVGQRLPADASPEQIQAFADKVAPALQQAGISIKDLVNGGFGVASKAADAVKTYFSAFDSATGKSKAVGKALADLGNEMDTNVSQAGALKTALDSLFGVQLSQSAATDAAVLALRALSKAMQAAKGDVLSNSKAALGARDATRSYVAAQEAKVEADAAADGSGRKAAETLLKTRDNIIATARAAGASKKDIKALVDEMGLTPANLQTIITTPGLLNAKQQVQALGKLYGLTPKQVKTLIAQAGMDRSKAEIDALAKKYHLTPKQVKTLIKADGSQALAEIARVNYAKIKDKTFTITTYYDAIHRDKNLATFAPPPKQHATGGYIRGPGTTTSDDIPAFLSDKEYVVQAAAVDHYGVSLFDRLNSLTFAAGGPVSAFPRFATGGQAHSTMIDIPGFEIVVPNAAALAFAQGIAAASAVQAKSAKELRADHLADLQAQVQIRDIQRELNKMEGKKGHRHLALRGLDRKEKKAELASAKDDLATLRNQAAQAKADAAKEAADALAQARQASIDTLTGQGDIFARGSSPASAIASVNRTIADISQYGQTLSVLKTAGASPALLQQMVSHAEAGDFKSAIRLGKALLADPAMLKQLNSSLASLGAVSASVGQMTTDPRFLSSTAWNPSTVAPKVVQVQLNADPTAWLAEVRRTITHEVAAQLAAETR